MGLKIQVGTVANLLSRDEQGARYFQREFLTLSRYLISIHLEPHVEPTDIDVWSGHVFNRSNLQYLRRLSAHLYYTKRLPAPGDANAADDPLLQRYYRDYDCSDIGDTFFTFNHIIIHSDAEGYYIPQDFDNVLTPGDDCAVAGGVVGSSLRLRDECEKIASVLRLPLTLDVNDKRVVSAIKVQGAGATTWERYGRESFGCLQLYHAASHSITTRAAIVFGMRKPATSKSVTAFSA